MRRFHSRTMAALIQFLTDVLTNSQLDNFFTKFNLQSIYRRPSGAVAKLSRAQEVVAYLDRENRTGKTDAIWDQIIIEGIMELQKRMDEEDPRWGDIKRSLMQDGYTINCGRVVKNLAIEEAEKVGSQLDEELAKMGWENASRSLAQARQNYSAQQWETANAAIRSFLQEVFDKIAERIPGFDRNVKPGGNRRQFLQDRGFFSGDEGELIRAFFTILNTKGSHPGLSNENDCSTRLIIASALALCFIRSLIDGGRA